MLKIITLFAFLLLSSFVLADKPILQVEMCDFYIGAFVNQIISTQTQETVYEKGVQHLKLQYQITIPQQMEDCFPKVVKKIIFRTKKGIYEDLNNQFYQFNNKRFTVLIPINQIEELSSSFQNKSQGIYYSLDLAIEIQNTQNDAIKQINYNLTVIINNNIITQIII
ncbi:hypothetical protein IMG5_002470 [Ichthyophthirius multifiliis]|uniref:Transmembrane protein n=1 Tax=Ichthyophthirius multifiliis TaxID=5932 RepID=G0QJ51_ICHMU|nr:hypothetical protein IMG5_002470 [Ichthyophthirius multifiliis]EGR34775.1 hypothetical protein IMG5_002470 [Ichthyophthirius multifiliis]|eukprot:XP_004040079.1 hypothetical protein IMG5_002470 [Ichthyophthirius multifiliis]